MTILITGATGFVMSGLVRHLAERGQAVVAADLHPPDAALRGHLGGLAGAVTFRQVNVTDANAVRALVGEVRPERIVHGAAITAIPAEAERGRFVETTQVNVLGTLHLLDAVREVGAGRVLVVSRRERVRAFVPTGRPSPRTPYAQPQGLPVTNWRPKRSPSLR